MCKVGGERTLKWKKLVVGDEAPYLAFVAASAENTITTGVKFLLCENRKLKQTERENKKDTYNLKTKN